ncbi:PAAR domain-containing protein [Vibrio maritimus]|uniref:PAAR domain-containing protein n=1 Tax=Vibrio maritimus TaxID=990268 RepID=UPI001F396FA8|nr:PAAR domain-containing protein [Vibrio maritimus]
MLKIFPLDVLDDPSTTGGVIVEGCSTVLCDGKPAALVGGKATCPRCDKGWGIICRNTWHEIKIEHQYAALGEFVIECGCPLGSNRIVTPKGRFSFVGYDDGTVGIDINNQQSLSFADGTPLTAENVSKSMPPEAHQQAYRFNEAQQKKDKPIDIDDVYIIFADKKTDLKSFAQEIYLNDADDVIQHIININPHLKRTFHFLITGMPVVVSPWQTVHPDEADATSQVSELAELFFTLSPEQQAWFSEHHEEFASVMLTSTAMPNSTLYEVNDGQVEESNFTNQMIASVGSGIAGMKTQADRLQKEFQRFENYSKYVGEATKGIKGDRLKSNPDYKQWRKQARSFQSEVQAISTQFGAPNYIKNIQASKVNNYLNVGKKQLYKAKDFSKAISGIEMTALYKKSMEFSKYLGRAAWVATIFGVRDNFIDIAKTCAQDEGFSEACVRAGVKNSFSIAVNIGVGESIGFLGTRFAPTTYGLSIIPMAGGLYAWGLYGGNVSNAIGDGVEYAIFDLYGDTIELINGAQQ